jgi:ABC-2 type transport system permease protein
MNIAELIFPLIMLVGVDLIFLLVAFLAISLLARKKRAAFAVLRRNFLAYFSNPTGYVFLCLFVLLTSVAAFWPDEFFNSNLANLDQLNFWFPIIMLFFIPAITMSIWADERRQGTDELLLTLPADDFDIVVGKYLSVVAIYTVSLIFSQISTFLVLVNLSQGDVDTGLFCANYLGYWFVGLAMLAIGMVASFLTSNLTVGFILGALFNAPLAFAPQAEVIIPLPWLARLVSSFSLAEQFDTFGRGVVSIAPIVFFVLLTAAGLYYCMVLIGRRHWSGGADGNTMFLHYFGRCVAILVVVFAASFFFRQNDRPRFDVTNGKVSSVSFTTREIIRKLAPERPIVIEAFISNNIPEQYSKTRYELITLLKEFQSLSGSSKMQVELYTDLEPSSEEARRAKKQYGIEPQQVRLQHRGRFRDEEVLMGAAIRSGLSKVVIPFFESGIPVEYELVRSINTVAQPRRAKLGILNTDANFMGGFSMAGGGFSRIEKQPIVEELEKQYDVEGVDANDPIVPGRYDVLLAIQPSSLNPTQLKNLVDAVKAGIPTAIFEDPLPVAFQGVPATGAQKRAQGGPFGGGAPQPKGDIQALWKTLGLDIPVHAGFEGINPDIVWQRFNPHSDLLNLAQATDQWLFVREENIDGIDYLSEANPATAGLRELMFLYAGAINVDKDRKDVQVTPLAVTRPQSGLIKYDDIMTQMRNQTGFGDSQLQLAQGDELGGQTIVAYIEGAESSQPESTEAPAANKIRAFYVADMDCLAQYFYESRRRPEDLQINLRVQNVSFFLNVIDVLAGETNYPKVRSHEPQHATLRLFEQQAQQFRKIAAEEQKNFQEEFNNEIKTIEEENQRTISKFKEKMEKYQRDGIDSPEMQNQMINEMQRLKILTDAQNRKLVITKEKLEGLLNERLESSRNDAELKTRSEQAKYKYWAIFLPPIPPLLVGIAVFVSRRVREREGISKNRLR